MEPQKRSEIPYLRAWRLHRRMTHEELAKAAEVGRQTVIRLEKPGQRANELTIYKIAHGLGISVEDLGKAPKGRAA